MDMLLLLGVFGIGAALALLAYKLRNASIHERMNANALAHMDDPKRD